MTRPLLNLLTALSLLVCVAAAALWAGSYMGRCFVSHRGRLYLWGLRYPDSVQAFLMPNAVRETGQREPGPARPYLVAHTSDGVGTGRGYGITRDPPRLGLLGIELWVGE